MKRCEIEVGNTYIAKVSGALAKVRITGESPYGGWVGRNLATGREIRIRSAARLRRPANDAPYGRLADGSPKCQPGESD
ncbi:MAG TPA: hypothetical protein VFA33_23070 [Bryobacteraceae bacterium]|nr:hypothetical protein [Bryobacteraceae bacterium]